MPNSYTPVAQSLILRWRYLCDRRTPPHLELQPRLLRPERLREWSCSGFRTYSRRVEIQMSQSPDERRNSSYSLGCRHCRLQN
jgi:hypothetical protein